MRRSGISAGAVIGSGALAQALAACGGGSSSQTAGSRTLTIGIAADPATIDPSFGTGAQSTQIIKNLYAPWLRYEVDQDAGEVDRATIVGNAAASYEIDDARENYTFTVRQGVTFPKTGNEMTADDFITAFTRSLENESPGAFPLNVSGFTDVDAIQKTGDYSFTIRAEFASPIAPLALREQSTGVVDSRELARHESGDPDAQQWLARNYAGNGPYQLSRWDTGSTLVLDVNPDYLGAEPFFDTVRLRIIPSADDRVLLLRDGTLDMAHDLTIDSLRALEGDENVTQVSSPSMLQYMFGLVQNKPPFDDVRVRRAVAHAIDYESLANDVLSGLATAPEGVWPANSRWFQTPWDVTFDPQAARQMLDAAGASNVEFTVEVDDSDAEGEALAIAVQTMLRDAGMTMEIRRLPSGAFSDRQFGHEMQAYIVKNGSFVDDPYYHLFLWMESEALLNWPAYQNGDIDRLTQQLLNEPDEDTRMGYAARAQSILNEDVPLINLGDARLVVPMRNELSGFIHEPDDLVPYQYLRRE